MCRMRHPHLVSFLGLCTMPPSILTGECCKGKWVAPISSCIPCRRFLGLAPLQALWRRVVQGDPRQGAALAGSSRQQIVPYTPILPIRTPCCRVLRTWQPVRCAEASKPLASCGCRADLAAARGRCCGGGSRLAVPAPLLATHYSLRRVLGGVGQSGFGWGGVGWGGAEWRGVPVPVGWGGGGRSRDSDMSRTVDTRTRAGLPPACRSSRPTFCFRPAGRRSYATSTYLQSCGSMKPSLQTAAPSTQPGWCEGRANLVQPVVFAGSALHLATARAGSAMHQPAAALQTRCAAAWQRIAHQLANRGCHRPHPALAASRPPSFFKGAISPWLPTSFRSAWCSTSCWRGSCPGAARLSRWAHPRHNKGHMASRRLICRACMLASALCLQAAQPSGLPLLPSTLILWCPQIRRWVLDGRRPEVPPREAMPGPDSAQWHGLDAYCELMR